MATCVTDRRASLDVMSPVSCCCGRVRSSAAVNEAIKRLCEATPVWTPEALTVLARLRAEWQAAVESGKSTWRHEW